MAWAVTGPVGRMAAQLGAQMLLARLLMPADFGTFAVMLLLVTLSGYLSELGGAAQLVRQAELDELDISTQLTAQLGIGLIVFGLTALAAMPATRFFHVPQAWPMMVAVGLNPVLVSLGVVAQRLLSRRQQFRTLQLVNLGAYLLGYALVATLMAWQGAGAWALVGGTLAQSLLASAACIAFARHSWSLRFDPGRWLRHAALGLQAFFSGLLTWGLFSADRLLVGRLFNPAVTGAYVNAFNLSAAPVWQITSSVQQQLFAKGSRMAADTEGLRRHFEATTLAVVLVVIPAMVGLSLLADPIVNIVLGARWQASAPILSVLALAMPFYVLYGVSTPYLWAVGRIDWDVGMQLVTLIGLCGAIALLTRADIRSLTWTVVGAYAVRSLAGALVTLAVLGGRGRHAIAMLGRLACALIPAAGAVAAQSIGWLQAWPVALAAAAVVAVAAWALCALLADPASRDLSRGWARLALASLQRKSAR